MWSSLALLPLLVLSPGQPAEPDVAALAGVWEGTSTQAGSCSLRGERTRVTEVRLVIRVLPERQLQAGLTVLPSDEEADRNTTMRLTHEGVELAIASTARCGATVSRRAASSPR